MSAAGQFHQAVTDGGSVVQQHVYHVGKLLPRWMGGSGVLAMGPADHADNRQPPAFRSFSHLDDYFADPARRDHDHHVLRAERKVAKNLLGVAEGFLQVQTLPQAVRPNDGIVISEPQLDDRVPADEAALPRSHFLTEHPAVAAAKEVYQAAVGDGVGAERCGPVERLTLSVEQTMEQRKGLMVESFRRRQGMRAHNR